MSFHPTRREITLGIILTVLFGLFLQFDLSLRFADASDADSLLGLKLGFGHGRDDSSAGARSGKGNGKGDKWLQDVETGILHAKGQGAVSMAESKVRWGSEGAVRTEVLGHAPGE